MGGVAISETGFGPVEGAWYACCKGDSYQLYYHTPAATFSRKNRTNAIHYTGKYDPTYFTFADAGKSPEIVYFDRDTGCFTEPLKVGETPLPHDAHGNPSLLIDHEGYLYVFYGSHGTPTLMKRFTHPPRGHNLLEAGGLHRHSHHVSAGLSGELNHPVAIL